jgi:plasmid stabilization system protein ParE
LEAIAQYIALDSSVYAKTVVRTILKAARSSSQFPYAGRIVPEFSDQGLRELFAYSYRIIYRIEGDVVTIAAIVHGKRLLDNL